MRRVIILIALFIIITITINHGQGEKNLTNNPADDRYASYSPSGKQIIFESNRDGNWNIYIMDSDGNNQKQLTTNLSEDRRPSWHPNGKKIIFESNRSGQNELYTLRIKCNKIKKFEMNEIDGEPSFVRYSPNGNWIAVTLTKTDKISNIAIVDRRGRSIKKLTDYRFRSFYPTWSLDSKILMFSSRHETNNNDDEIYQINIDGTNKVRLTDWPKHNFCPMWSNDGSKIAYVTSMDSVRPEIYIMDANGDNKIRVTHNEDGDTLPNWSIDDKRLLITGYRQGNFEICELQL